MGENGISAVALSNSVLSLPASVDFETVRKGYVGDRQWSTTAVLRNNLPREEMANPSLDDEVLVIHVLGRRIESCADTIARKTA